MLTGSRQQPAQQNNPLAMMGQLRQMVSVIRGQDPQKLMQTFAQRNSQFAEFLRANQGKTPEQIAAENGIDMNLVRDLMR